MSSAMDELLERFKTEADERITRIESLVVSTGDDDRESIREEAHKIKGAAGMLGFAALKDRAAAVEDLAATGPADDADQLPAAVAALRAALGGE